MQLLLNLTKILQPNKRVVSINHRTFRSSSDTYANLIQIYGRDRSLNRGLVLHAHLITNGLARLTYIASKLMILYTECGKLSDARKLFDKIPKTNIRRWIVIIGAYARLGYFKEALYVFNEMQSQCLKPNKFVIPSILKACGHLLDGETGKKLHCVVLRLSYERDAFVVSALIDMYSKCVKLERARTVFDNMFEKDLVALNAMVSGYVQHGFAKEALSFVEEMRLLGMKPNVVTWNTLIAGFSGDDSEVNVSKIFGLMRVDGIEPDVVSWTSMISGYVQSFRNDKAFDTFKEMLCHGLYPRSVTISSILPACASQANDKLGKEIHGFAITIGAEDDIYVRSALIDMYAKCGFISDAQALFSKMRVKNTVTINSMIFGYANHGRFSEAVELFNKTEQEERQKLDHLTFTAVLTACSHGGLIELGQKLFKSMQEDYGIAPRLEHYACMVDLLGRAGRVQEGYDMIKEMPVEPDLFVWGALLGACRNHGNIDLAEVAVKRLSELEPTSSGNGLLLSNLYADAGSWGDVARLKKVIKSKRLRKLAGCSWIDSSRP